MYTKQEIASCLLESSRSLSTCIQQMNNERFFAPAASSAWSPAQHLEHLVRSTAAVNYAITMPRFILRLFGKPNRPGRTYDELKKKYLEKLSKGGRATGRYVPPDAHKVDRNKVQARYRKVSEKLLLKVSAMQEDDMDKYLLPHPLLGKITLREMFFFTIYHTYHHLDIINNNRSV
ncbi:MAG: DinB family protein [Dinghuibacter sp.]|nr:DinB family protein [Dinghuibacter sp.]